MHISIVVQPEGTAEHHPTRPAGGISNDLPGVAIAKWSSDFLGLIDPTPLGRRLGPAMASAVGGDIEFVVQDLWPGLPTRGAEQRLAQHGLFHEDGAGVCRGSGAMVVEGLHDHIVTSKILEEPIRAGQD